MVCYISTGDICDDVQQYVSCDELEFSNKTIQT